VDKNPARHRHLRRRIPPKRSWNVLIQLRPRQRRLPVRVFQHLRSRMPKTHRLRLTATRVWNGAKSVTHLQLIRCPQRHLRHRTPALYSKSQNPIKSRRRSLLRPPRIAGLSDVSGI